MALLFTCLCVFMMFPMSFMFFGKPIFGFASAQPVEQQYSLPDETLDKHSKEFLATISDETEKQKMKDEISHEYQKILTIGLQEKIGYHATLSQKENLINSRYNQINQSLDMVSVLAVLFNVLSVAVLFVPGSIMGFNYVSRIRKDRVRPGLIRGVFAILLWPTGITAIVLCAVFAAFFESIFRGSPSQHAASVIGGGIGLFLAAVLLGLTIWGVYLWLRPKTVAPPAPTLPKSWAAWGTGFVIVAIIVSLFVFPMVLLLYINTTPLANGVMTLETTHKVRTAQFEKWKADLSRELKNTTDTDEVEKRRLQANITMQDQNIANEKINHDRMVSNLRQRHASSQMIMRCIIYLIICTAMIFGILGTIFGWRYLYLVRGQTEKPGIGLGYFSAYAFPIYVLFFGLGALLAAVLFS